MPEPSFNKHFLHKVYYSLLCLGMLGSTLALYLEVILNHKITNKNHQTVKNVALKYTAKTALVYQRRDETLFSLSWQFAHGTAQVFHHFLHIHEGLQKCCGYLFWDCWTCFSESVNSQIIGSTNGMESASNLILCYLFKSYRNNFMCMLQIVVGWDRIPLNYCFLLEGE